MDVNVISRFTEGNKEKKKVFLIGQSLFKNYQDNNPHYNILI